jgi:hypothetical protein
MNFFAYSSSDAQRVVSEDHARKRDYRNFIQIAFERLEFGPKSLDVLDRYLDSAVVDFAEGIHLLLLLPSTCGLEFWIVRKRNVAR